MSLSYGKKIMYWESQRRTPGDTNKHGDPAVKPQTEFVPILARVKIDRRVFTTPIEEKRYAHSLFLSQYADIQTGDYVMLNITSQALASDENNRFEVVGKISDHEYLLR